MKFSDMSIDDLVDYVNNKLILGNSLVRIASELNVNESSIRKKLKKAGYKRSGNEFIYVGQSGGQVVSSSIKSNIPEERAIKVGQKEDGVLQGKDKKNFIELMSNFNVIMEMVEQYKKSSVLPTGDIVIQLPYEETKDYKTSIRVNKTIMEQFREFCDKHKEFSQKELISAALMEFMDRYN
ncbi:MAG: hypothetical protein SOY04_12610 [Clostridium celatum]|nr:hypothetical protein [Clostridium celatum]